MKGAAQDGNGEMLREQIERFPRPWRLFDERRQTRLSMWARPKISQRVKRMPAVIPATIRVGILSVVAVDFL